MQAASDASYQVELQERPEVGTATYHLLVTRHGRPVTDARVCVRVQVDSGGTTPTAARNVATEVSPGRYRIGITLTGPGSWRGAAVVSEPGRRAVGVPLDIDVP